MTSVGIIPARYGASRFEGKVLANIAGKPMIQHVWENAKKAHLLDDLIIACDDERIIKVVEEFADFVKTFALLFSDSRHNSLLC